MLCALGYGPMQYAIYVFMLVDMFMLCYVMLSQFPDFGPMQGARPQLVRTSVRCRGRGPSQFRTSVRCRGRGPSQFSDFGPMQGTGSQIVSPDFGPMQGTGSQSVGKAQYVLYMYCMVCGSLGELTKLRAYSFSFGFRYFGKQKEELGMMALHILQFQLLYWEFISDTMLC